MKILITGADGMLGKELTYYLDNIGYFVIPTNKEQLDITNNKQVTTIIEKIHPNLIIHCAAYTNVDKAEKEKKLSSKINIDGTRNISIAAQKIGATVIYISTDYVFDGEKKEKYNSYDTPNPINHYGYTKLKGEEEIKKHCKKHYIIRTSWLYGKYGNNFIKKILENNDDSIKIVNDQTGCPTWTFDLAQEIMKILSKPYGIYHIASQGETNWYEYAKKIIEIKKLNKEIKPIKSEYYQSAAKRPKYSALKSDIELPFWVTSLSNYLELN